jgi:hypothetical protein
MTAPGRPSLMYRRARAEQRFVPQGDRLVEGRGGVGQQAVGDREIGGVPQVLETEQVEPFPVGLQPVAPRGRLDEVPADETAQPGYRVVERGPWMIGQPGAPGPVDEAVDRDHPVRRSMLDNVGDVFRDRIGAGFGLGLPRGDITGSFGLVAYHPGERHQARSWRIDLTGQSIAPDGQLPADWLVTGDVATWLAVLAGRQNMASCIRSGLLRYIDPGDRAEGLAEAVLAEQRLTVVRELLGLAGYPEEPAIPVTEAY